ncbi:hypothetical protein ACT3SZ_00105 [Corynebacterium sp. AOP40-9SA-29]|uniref:hypothetical protein n=1 Tax=Corynebacterium sp. AOP40-9SA-29 TaxID=3457677 RepID=UPI0040344282
MSRSPIEAALEGYIRQVDDAAGKFQRQMDEATELLGELGDLSDLRELLEANGTDNNDAAPRQDTAGRPPRRSPGIFD